MGLFKKKPDPFSERARALSTEIARLQEEIAVLSAQSQPREGQPRFRSTVLPHGPQVQHPALAPREPIFEEVDHQRVKAPAEFESTAAHFNELGARKFD